MSDMIELLLAGVVGGLTAAAALARRSRKASLHREAELAWDAEFAAYGVWRIHEPFIFLAATVDGLVVAEPSLSDDALCARALSQLERTAAQGYLGGVAAKESAAFVTAEVVSHARRQLARLAELANIDGLLTEERKDIAIMIYASEPVALHVAAREFSKAIERKFKERPLLAVGYSTPAAARDLLWPTDGPYRPLPPRLAHVFGDVWPAADDLRVASISWVTHLWRTKGTPVPTPVANAPTTETTVSRSAGR